MEHGPFSSMISLLTIDVLPCLKCVEVQSGIPWKQSVLHHVRKKLRAGSLKGRVRGHPIFWGAYCRLFCQFTAALVMLCTHYMLDA